jgi:hypothetical protein
MAATEATMITLKCPKGHTRQVPEALAGHTVTCFQCTHKWKVPGSAAGQKKAHAKKIADRVLNEIGGAKKKKGGEEEE